MNYKPLRWALQGIVWVVARAVVGQPLMMILWLYILSGLGEVFADGIRSKNESFHI